MDGSIVVHPFCTVCGPNAEKCIKTNPKCRSPKTIVTKKVHDKAARAYLLASRKKKLAEILYVYNYYHYGPNDYFWFEE